MTDKNLMYTVDELNIPDYSKIALKKKDYSNLEVLLSLMLCMPCASKNIFQDLGLNYDDVKKQIYCILPEDITKKAEEYVKNPFQRGFGAMPPIKKK